MTKTGMTSKSGDGKGEISISSHVVPPEIYFEVRALQCVATSLVWMILSRVSRCSPLQYLPATKGERLRKSSIKMNSVGQTPLE
jgi:hypothetical protein